jgi:hypothetical protein
LHQIVSKAKAWLGQCWIPVAITLLLLIILLVAIWRGLSPPWQAWLLTFLSLIILAFLALYELNGSRQHKQLLTFAFGLELVYALLLVGGATVYNDVPLLQVRVPKGTQLTLSSDVTGGPSHGTFITVNAEALGSARIDMQDTVIALPSGSPVTLLHGAHLVYKKGADTLPFTLPTDTATTAAKDLTVLSVAPSQSLFAGIHRFLRDLLPDPVGPIPLGIPFLGALGAVVRGLSWSMPPPKEETGRGGAEGAVDSAVSAKVSAARADDAVKAENTADAVKHATDAAQHASDAATAALAATDGPVVRPSDANFLRWHIMRPFLGAAFSAFTFLFFLAILGTTVNGQPGGQWGVYLLAFVVGYSDSTFAALIQRTVNVLIGPGKPQSSG